MTMIGMEMIFQTDLAAAGLNMKYVVRNVDVTALSSLELDTKVAENYLKFNNHREGPYLGLLMVESAY